MKTKNRMLVVAACCIAALLCGTTVYAAPAPDGAYCDITVTVESIIEWESTNFATITLDAQSGDAPIDAHGDAPEGSAAYTLWTNCNVVLTADTSTDARLKNANDSLVTKYKLSVDGDGASATGATVTAINNSSSGTWTLYSSFLSTGLQIAHVYTDGNVEVTLSVQATNNTDEVADSGSYYARQTITATWVSDHDE